MMRSSKANLKSLLRLLDRIPRLRIGVIGDLAADHYLVGKTSRISREAPVLILKKQAELIQPGQAGNSAANLAGLGAETFAFGVVGPDERGKGLVQSLLERGVNCAGVIRARNGGTITKTRVLAGAHHTNLQQVIRLDDDENLRVVPAERRKLAATLKKILPRLDAVLVSDYGYGTVDEELWNALGETKAAKGRKLLRVLDSRHGLGSFRGADVITPNETEVFEHLGIQKFAGADPMEAGKNLIARAACKGLVMTRGNEGMIVFDSGAAPVPLPIYGTDEVTDVTGAGDTVAAVVTAMRAAGASLLEAAQVANVAGGLKVMKRGAVAVGAEEIRAALLKG